jgi:hypothetical protein
MGRSSFGVWDVRGLRRVPDPAAGMTAFVMIDMRCFLYIASGILSQNSILTNALQQGHAKRGGPQAFREPLVTEDNVNYPTQGQIFLVRCSVFGFFYGLLRTPQELVPLCGTQTVWGAVRRLAENHQKSAAMLPQKKRPYVWCVLTPLVRFDPIS